jgi:hypothetical protein
MAHLVGKKAGGFHRRLTDNRDRVRESSLLDGQLLNFTLPTYEPDKTHDVRPNLF